MKIYTQLNLKSIKKILSSVRLGTIMIIRMKNPEDYLIGERGRIRGKNMEFQQQNGEFVVLEPVEILVPLKRIVSIKLNPFSHS